MGSGVGRARGPSEAYDAQVRRVEKIEVHKTAAVTAAMAMGRDIFVVKGIVQEEENHVSECRYGMGR